MTSVNPFHYGSPAGGEFFADRQDELFDITGRMLNGQNVILLSPRRYGKTSLLLEAMRRVRASRGRTGYASMLLCSSPRDVAETLLTAVLNGPLSWLARQHGRLAQLLGGIRLTPSVEVEPGGSLRVSLSPSAAQEDWRQALASALRLLSEAEQGSHPASLVLDEFQRVAEIDSSLPGVFKVMADELQRVSLVFSGSKMHIMERLAVGPGAPLLGMGERITLGQVPEAEMARYLVARAKHGGKRMAAGAAHALFAQVDGVPNDVQCLAYEAFALAEGEIDLDTLDQAMARIVGHRSIDYEESYARLAPVQQRVLRALARQPRAEVYSRSFLAEVDVANANAVRKALDVLTDLELVARRASEWTVADAFFRAWLHSAG